VISANISFAPAFRFSGISDPSAGAVSTPATSLSAVACDEVEPLLALSILLLELSSLGLEEPGIVAVASILVLLLARCRGGGGGGGATADLLGVPDMSMLATEGGRPECLIEDIRAGGSGGGAALDLEIGRSGSLGWIVGDCNGTV